MRATRRASRVPAAGSSTTHSRASSASGAMTGPSTTAGPYSVLSDENAAGIAGPQRTQAGIGLAHKASSSNMLARVAKGAVGNKEGKEKVTTAARRVLGDVSNAVKGSKATDGPSEAKPATKPSRVRNASAAGSVSGAAASTGLSSAVGKGLKVSSSLGTAGGRKTATTLKSRPSTQSLRTGATGSTRTAASRTTSGGPASVGLGISRSQSAGDVANNRWGSSQGLATVASADDEIEVLEDEPTGPSHGADEDRMEVENQPAAPVDPAHMKVSLPGSVFAAVEADNQANTSEHDLVDDDEDDAAPRGIASEAFDDHNDLSIGRSDADHMVDAEEDIRTGENWLLLSPKEERQCRDQIEQIKRDFQEELDFWDTTMVAEYSDEIFQYMETLEEKSMANPRYMEFQTEIEWHMRATLIDWLLQVHMRYHMLPETLWIAINIVDRFLSRRVVSLVKLQLVGVTAMFIAAKYEEIMAPSVEEFVFMTEHGYTRDEILKGERIILTNLDFNISPYCSPYSWLRRISKADDYDIQTRTLSKFLMEVTLLDHRFLRAKPSMVAAIGMYTARKMLNGDWSEPFVFYSNFTEAQLATPMEFVIENLAEPTFEERFVYKKYANKKFLKASVFARQFAVNYAASREASVA